VSDVVWEGFAAVLVVAAVYLLVRPSGDGPAMVQAATGSLADVISYAAAT
jgi:hypothetical protein